MRHLILRAIPTARRARPVRPIMAAGFAAVLVLTSLMLQPSHRA